VQVKKRLTVTAAACADAGQKAPQTIFITSIFRLEIRVCPVSSFADLTNAPFCFTIEHTWKKHGQGTVACIVSRLVAERSHPAIV
jgi:hypothetical protein